jgi:xanthine/CO dehydrogenase XdhC/CoxF family maturation factor
MTRFCGQLAAALTENQPFVLALISGTKGSSPQRIGAKALFFPDGKIVGNEYTNAVPAEPKNAKESGVLHADLAGVNAMRFKATLGGDYPPGNEAQRRKVYAVRAANGTEARFLTVIEPYEDEPVVKSAEALSADKIRVELADGRVQEIEFQNFDGDGKDIRISMTESKDGHPIRTETAVTKAESK